MRSLRLAASSRVGFRTCDSASLLRRLEGCSARHGINVTGRKHSSGISSVKASPWPSSSTDKVNIKHPLKKAANSKQTAYIALGSNLGDRIGWIERACDEMDRRGIKVTRTSSLWETKPMYVLDQNEFINGVCEVETTLAPIPLLDELQDIENSLGRKKIIDKGPRNIDLDILLYGDETVKHERLNIPHASLTEREFILRPLAELAPHKSLNSAKPWRLCQDYLNLLPPAETPMSTIIPMSTQSRPISALRTDRTTHIMGIVNVTPDSFSDGGKHHNEDLSSTISEFVEADISIFDIGGQSTAPGAPEVSVDEEISRVVPAIRQIRSHQDAKNSIISIDTYRAAVAEAAVAAGADIVNDVSAGQLDPDMLKTVARLGKTICLMHMRGTPATMSKLTDYPDGLIPTIATELLQRVHEAEAAGIRRWRILLDPGIGFAKTKEQNLEILRQLDELRSWPGLIGIPWLVGSSRKKFIGAVTGVSTPKDRIWGSAVAVSAAVQGGADIVRVHDVKEMAQVVKMADAIYRV